MIDIAAVPFILFALAFLGALGSWVWARLKCVRYGHEWGGDVVAKECDRCYKKEDPFPSALVFFGAIALAIVIGLVHKLRRQIGGDPNA